MNLYMIYYFLVRFGSAATLFCGSLRTLKLDANYDTNSNCYSTKTEIKKMNHATDFLCGRRGGGGNVVDRTFSKGDRSNS